MTKPTLSVLALCYNHSLYLEEALVSIENLTFPNVEVWIADDASTDNSAEILHRWKSRKPDWNFVFNIQNQGNCKTFNTLLAQAKGDWVIDFATDDVLLPNVFEGWIEQAEVVEDTGFCYADALIFGESGRKETRFSATLSRKKYPEGKILTELVNATFICPPAVIFRREKLNALGGYNENLAFEDWDIWLRMAQKYHISHHAETVIKYRKHPSSLSASILLKRNQDLLNSTLDILHRISAWPEFRSDPRQLSFFTRYHLRLCFALQLPEQALGFFLLLKKSGNQRPIDFWLNQFSGKLPFVYPLFRIYHKLKTWFLGV